MDKPVIILGGGFVGTLLALRLKELHPQLTFTLYEESSALGGTTNCVFTESDSGPLFQLLKQMISHSWCISSPLYLIKPETLHAQAIEKLNTNVKLNNDISIEIALKESSFVIDTRDICYFKKAGYAHGLSLEVELEADHHFQTPVLFDGTSGDDSEYFSYFPLNDKQVIIQHHCYSEKFIAKRDDQFNRILQFINLKGLKINRVIEEKFMQRPLPTSKPYVHQENRVISLSHFSNPTTGCKLTALSTIIDKMVRTSFRYGELKSLIKDETQNFETKIEFYHYLNQQILSKKSLILETIFDQSSDVIERFYQNNLSFFDRSKILYCYSLRRISEVAKLLTVKKLVTLEGY